MKTLYIHIGCPKTATTSIQYFCNENKEILSKNGVYFPILNKNIKMLIHIAMDIFLLPISMIPMEKSIL